MRLRSEKARQAAPEMDPLRMGMGWKAEDLSKPQIMVESSYGDSHPGSAHLNQFVEEAVRAVDDHGGKVCPEAAAGGPIALVEEGDLIELDVEARRIAIIGVRGGKKTEEEMEQILKERKARWKGFQSKYQRGLLKLYAQHAVSSMKGAYME